MNQIWNIVWLNLKIILIYCKHECLSKIHHASSALTLAGNISNGPHPVNVQDIEALSPDAALIE